MSTLYHKFKYLNKKHLEEIIKSKKIHFSEPRAFNDPFEIPEYILLRSEEAYKSHIRINKLLTKMKSGLNDYLADGPEVIMEQLTKLLNKPVLEFPWNSTMFWSDAWDEFQERRRIKHGYSLEKLKAFEKDQITRDLKKINETYVILSLAGSNNSLLMWSHYADSHKGAVIEFDVNHSEFNVVPKTKEPFETVNRTDAFGMREDKRGTQMSDYVTYKENDMRPLLDPIQPILMYNFFSKSFEWKYEEEYRIIRLRNDGDELTAHGAKFPLPPAALKSITLGVRFGETENGVIDEKKQQELVDLVRRDQQFNHVDIWTANISETHFNLKMKLLSKAR